MKKILSLTLALLMVLAIPCTASATEATSELIIESFSMDEVIKAPSLAVYDGSTLAFNQFSFDGCTDCDLVGYDRVYHV